jgi:uncharacterized protein
MAALGRVIVEAIVHHYGRDELLSRLSNPFWFQSFGAVMGMDWHSSGITTSVLAALKRGLGPVQGELGIYVCGGKGAHSRRTPMELLAMGDRTGIDAAPLIQASRLVAKIDSAVVQDGYDLYLHGFVASTEGKWCVIQQGMNERQREARRYHWKSENLVSFFDSPHSAVEGRNIGPIVNLADTQAAASRSASLTLVESGPDRTIEVLKHFCGSENPTLDLFPDACPVVPHQRTGREPAFLHDAFRPPTSHPHLTLPSHHDVKATDIDLKRLHGTLRAALERGPKDFAQLLLTPGVGARTVTALAFVAEIVHGAPYRFSDPARFSFAHGGKDGHPFPVPLKVYDETINVLKVAIGNARLDRSEKLSAIKRLDQRARMIDGIVSGPSIEELVATEQQNSTTYGGRTV